MMADESDEITPEPSATHESRDPHAPDTAQEEREAFISHEQAVNAIPEEVDSSSGSRRDPSPTALKSSAAVPRPSTTLHRSGYILFLVLLYAALALTSWVLLCLLTKKPLTADHYGVNIDLRHDNGYGAVSFLYIHGLYVKSEHIFRAAKIIQAVVSVLTIPLTSAVCSKAAVIFVQQRRQRLGFSMRQLMALADKGWTDPEVISRLIFAGWKKYGSSFLLLAILLNLLGAAVWPIATFYVKETTIKTPLWPEQLLGLTGISDFFNTDGITRDDNLVTVLTRSALTSTTNTDIQARLWTEAWTCNQLNHTDSSLPSWCTTGGGITLGNISTLPDPWLAQLPSSYNTGLIKQFLPRFNSSVSREKLTADEMPKDCASLPGAFYARYAKLGVIDWLGSGNWSIEICMPADQRSTPWKNTRRRQDFTEELYLNISVLGYNFAVPDDPQSQGGIFKFTSRTTGGYFELPNYMNDEKPGPLIDGDPNDYCGIDCEPQGNIFDPEIHDHNLTAERRSESASISDIAPRAANATIVGSVMKETSLSLDAVMNKGPLLTTTLALFGDNSFISSRLKHTEAYIYDGIPYHAKWNDVCVEKAPFVSLLRTDSGSLYEYGLNGNLDPCITNYAGTWRDIDSQIVAYIIAFYYNGWDGFDGERITNAFTSAVFLATEQWLINPVVSFPEFTVWYDLGSDIQIPVISHRGMIIVSVLLGLFLVCLFAMAIYSAIIPRWTSQLDSFAMMRIGAAMSEHLPLDVGHKISEIEILDKQSGFIGDAAPGEPGMGGREMYVGELGLGAGTTLKGGTRYRCYPGDHNSTITHITRMT